MAFTHVLLTFACAIVAIAAYGNNRFFNYNHNYPDTHHSRRPSYYHHNDYNRPPRFSNDRIVWGDSSEHDYNYNFQHNTRPPHRPLPPSKEGRVVWPSDGGNGGQPSVGKPPSRPPTSVGRPPITNGMPPSSGGRPPIGGRPPVGRPPTASRPVIDRPPSGTVGGIPQLGGAVSTLLGGVVNGLPPAVRGFNEHQHKQRLFALMYQQMGTPFANPTNMLATGLSSLDINANHISSVRNSLQQFLTQGTRLQRQRSFSYFRRAELQEAMTLFQSFIGFGDIREFLSCCVVAREQANEELYIFAMTAAILYRPDTQGMFVPPVEEIMPYKFIPSPVISEAETTCKQWERNRVSTTQPVTVYINQTHNDLDPEFKLGYFREDISLNAHHWHWHVIYPFTWNATLGPRDRKGELFYYMHQQMLARFQLERLSHHMPRVRALDNLREPLTEGYAPRLTNSLSGRSYASRPSNIRLGDIPTVTIEQMNQWKTRIMDAVNKGVVSASNGTQYSLNALGGIDQLGSMIESSTSSISQTLYGNYHNDGHDVISRAHDPDGRFREEPGVMAFPETAVRDPIFFRWHKAIDDMFQEFKATLPPYTQNELGYAGVHVRSISVRGELTAQFNQNDINKVMTFYQERSLFLSNGIDFTGNFSVRVIYRHLQHESLTYNIEVENMSGRPRDATVRIFLGPKYDELGQELNFNEQRRLFIELDKYYVSVPPGRQTLRRQSRQSSVTRGTNPGLNILLMSPPNNTDAGLAGRGCGWPAHLLIPHGDRNGHTFQIFVMLSNWEQDRVSRNQRPPQGQPASYCGQVGQLYPDRRAMGFPFDRPVRTADTMLSGFRTGNMAFADLRIDHNDNILQLNGQWRGPDTNFRELNSEGGVD